MKRKSCLSGILLGALLALLVFSATPAWAAVNAVNAGDILAANFAAESVVRINPANGLMWKLGTFTAPTDLAMATNGYLYVTEHDGLIQRLDLVNGLVTPVNAPGTLAELWGVAIGPANELYVTSRATRGVIRVDPETGQVTPLVHTQGGEQEWPAGIVLADPNHLLVAFYNSDKIVSVTLNTNTPPTTLAGAAEGINLPWGLALAGGFVYCADQDRRMLQRLPISGGSVTDVSAVLGLPYDLSVDLEGNIVLGAIAPDEVRVVTPQGNLLRSYVGELLNWVTGVEVASRSILGAEQVNTPPLLEPIPNRTVSEGNLLTFSLSVLDTNWPPQQVQFKLIEPFPDGAKLTANGLFDWTPVEAHGPGSYVLTVQAGDDGQPSLSATQSFTITVSEANLAPSITPISMVKGSVGVPVQFTIAATDPDVPAQGLSFSLVDAPAGVSISPAGVFTWTPAVSQGGSNHVMKVVVTDDGSPPLAATNSFSVSVSDRNVPPVFGLVTNQVVNENRLLTYLVRASDSNQPPQNLTFSLQPGAPAGAAITPAGFFTWTPGEAEGPGQYTIEVKVSDDGFPPLSATNRFSLSVQEVNTAPTLGFISAQSAHPDVLFQMNIRASATDTDLPPQTLTFSLETGAPEGARISPEGVLTWVPAPAQAPGTHWFAVRVNDNGTPSLSAVQSFPIELTLTQLVIEVGDVLAANYSGNSVLSIHPQTGAQQRLGTFDQPTDLAMSPSGALYVSEWGGLVKRLDLASRTLSVVNPGTSLTEVWGLAIGPAGDLFVTGSADDRIVKINPLTGAETVLAQGDLLSGPYGIDLLDSGHLVVSCMFNHRLVSVALADGVQSLIVEENGLDLPRGVAVSGSDIYVAGYGPGLIQRVANGAVHPVYAMAEGQPAGIAVDSAGEIVASASGFGANRLVRISPQGALLDTYSGGLIGEMTGIEISTSRVEYPSIPAMNLTIADQGNGTYLLRFEGIPQVVYSIEFATNLSPSDWQTLATTNADATGLFMITATNSAPRRYYRSVFKSSNP